MAEPEINGLNFRTRSIFRDLLCVVLVVVSAEHETSERVYWSSYQGAMLMKNLATGSGERRDSS